MYILSFEDEERQASVLGPFSELGKAQEYAEKDHNAPLQWGQAADFTQETWMSDENSYGAYYTIVKFEMNPEYVFSPWED